MKTVAIIQARMGSTRLPGKVLKPLGPSTWSPSVLSWVARAAAMAPGVDIVCIATSTDPRDDEIARWADGRPVALVRGSETDVLERFNDAAKALDADVILRLTGDCPFLDPRVIGEVVRLRAATGAAYCSNIHPRTYPDGLDVECFTREALTTAFHKADQQIDRDTVTFWITRNRARFPAQAVVNPLPDLQHERWVLDTEADLEFCQAIAQRWPYDRTPPSMLNILDILDKEPELRDLNRDHAMNERFYEDLARLHMLVERRRDELCFAVASTRPRLIVEAYENLIDAKIRESTP